MIFSGLTSLTGMWRCRVPQPPMARRRQNPPPQAPPHAAGVPTMFPIRHPGAVAQAVAVLLAALAGPASAAIISSGAVNPDPPAV
jgi:hypothetical protein